MRALMKRIESVWLIGVGALLVPLGVVALPAASLPEKPVVEPPTGQTVVCPAAQGKATVYAVGDAAIVGGAVAEKPTSHGTPVVLAGQTTATVLRSSKKFAASVYAADGATLGWANCASARTSTILQLARPKVSDVLVTNADDIEAAVDVTLFGPAGEIAAVGANGVVIPSRSSRVIPVSSLVADDTPIGVQVQTTAGRVSAVGRTWTTSIAEFSPGGAAASDLLIPGLPANATRASLVVTNPGTERATINVTAFGQQAFGLANGQNVVIEPRSTVALDVVKGIGKDPVGLHVASDQSVSGSVVTDLGGDIAVAPSVEPIVVGGLLTPGGGTVSISNPAASPVTVTLTIKPSEGTQPPAAQITLAAGQTWTSAAPTAKTVAYDLLASTPVIAAVTTTGATGMFIAPFESLATSTGTGVAVGYDIGLR